MSTLLTLHVRPFSEAKIVSNDGQVLILNTRALSVEQLDLVSVCGVVLSCAFGS